MGRHWLRPCSASTRRRGPSGSPCTVTTSSRPGITPKMRVTAARRSASSIFRKTSSGLTNSPIHVVVGANRGVEYVSNPVLYQRDLGGIAMQAGAGLLVGNHPHWVQAVEHFVDALNAYSFGNFIFDQAWSVHTMQGKLMELGFTSKCLPGYRIRPVAIRRHSGELRWIYRPEFVDPASEGRPILNRIWSATYRLPTRPEQVAE